MNVLVQDLRYACRALAASPGFTIAALLSLAIGIGANTAIFSVTSALLLRPLPYANADRQVILWNTSPGLGITEDWFSTAQYFDIKNNLRSFEDVAIAIGANANLTGDGEPERIGTIRVSSNLLSMLGALLILGIAAAAFAGTKQRSDPVAPPGTATWSYLCFAANSASDVMEKANRAGAQGWEMVSAGQGHQGAIWCFRQPQWARPQPVD